MAMRSSGLRSSVGEKILVALTGLALLLFLVVHLAGNLLLFGGPVTFNAYSHALIANPFIYVAEAGLAAIFVIHAYKTIVMWWRNRSARPEPYQAKHWAGAPSRKSVASTTMIVTGAVTAAFLYLHLQGLKFGPDYPAPGGMRDLYRLVVETFQNPYWVAFYEVSVVLVGLHLWHGFASAFESLGLGHPRYTPGILLAGRLIATAIGAGFVLIPLWIYLVGGRA